MSSGNDFDWENYILLSKELLDKDNLSHLSKATQRSAISRAYYGAFCLARNHAKENEGLNPKNNVKDHKIVKKHYINSPNKIKKKIGTKLDRLRKNRNNADYDNIYYKVNKYAIAAVKIAQKIETYILELKDECN